MSTTTAQLCPLPHTDPRKPEPLGFLVHIFLPIPRSCPNPWSEAFSVMLAEFPSCLQSYRGPQEKIPHLVLLSPAALMCPESPLTLSLPPLLIFSHTCVPPSSESRFLICSELWPRGLHLSGRVK